MRINYDNLFMAISLNLFVLAKAKIYDNECPFNVETKLKSVGFYSYIRVTSPTISIHLIHTETKPLFPHTPIMAAITAVSDLKPFKSMWKIQVKIIRLWKQYSAASGLTIEMVLIDSNVSILYWSCY